MFEKFTEKAVNVVTIAQSQAFTCGHRQVCPEHLLLGILEQKACLATKLLSFSGIRYDELLVLVSKNLADLKTEKNGQKAVVFSENLKNIFKRAFDISRELNNPSILVEHLFLALLQDKNSSVNKILTSFNFDVERNFQMTKKFLNKRKTIRTKDYHPENVKEIEVKSPYQDLINSLSDTTVNKTLDKATAKLGTSKYEILGTEQLLQSILEDCESCELKSILRQNGITPESVNEKLNEITNRCDEFETKQVVFTPNALKTMLLALETAKEFGSVTLEPEHVLLGVLKAQQGIAYKVIKKLKPDTDDLYTQILKPIERPMPETLIILRLAKQEARRLGKNIVGSEMILLGILGEGTGIGAGTLSGLGVNLKDVRLEIERIIGYGDSYTENQVRFTQRAKKIIEQAWEIAKNGNSKKINSEHLLLAITEVPDCFAMKVLEQLGVDVIEIRQGILKQIKNDDNSK